MTVAELREILTGYPGDMRVVVRDSTDQLYDLNSISLATMRSRNLWDLIEHSPDAAGERVVVIY